PLPEILSRYQYKPVGLISNLMGHEGEGSVLAELKKRGWAEGLSAGRSLSTEHASTLVVSISLTKLGLTQVDAITTLVLQYASILRTQGIPEYLKKEQHLLNEMAFRYQEHGSISAYTTRLSSNMLYFPTNDVIYGDYRADMPADELLQQYLDKITAENMLRTLIAPGVETDTTDPWYDTAIRIRPMTFAAVDITDSNLHLPVENPFIPENLEVNPAKKSDVPQLIT
ncbi:MAG: insulinase family protein, partial [Thalassolituus sp.]